MGNNRREYQNKTPSKICGKLSNNLKEKDKKELFELWKVYNELRSKGVKAIDCIEALYGENLDYFTAVGFEVFNKEYIKELNNEN